MVCDRCILAIRKEFDDLRISVADVKLGEVTILTALSSRDVDLIEERIGLLGFALLHDKNKKLIQDVKELVQKVYSGHYDFADGFRFSDLVASVFQKDYETTSKNFSRSEGITLEKYIIQTRIEKVKEYLLYHSSETLAGIAFKLGFTSAAHLSGQFKTETGLTPSHFKKDASNNGRRA